jgi:hypothetical protein
MGPLISQREVLRPPMTRLSTRIRVIHKQKASSRSLHPDTNPRRQHSQSVDEVFHRTIAIQLMKGSYPVSRQQVKTKIRPGFLTQEETYHGGSVLTTTRDTAENNQDPDSHNINTKKIWASLLTRSHPREQPALPSTSCDRAWKSGQCSDTKTHPDFNREWNFYYVTN